MQHGKHRGRKIVQTCAVIYFKFSAQTRSPQVELNKYVNAFKISGHREFRWEVKGWQLRATSEIRSNGIKNKPTHRKQTPNYLKKKIKVTPKKVGLFPCDRSNSPLKLRPLFLHMQDYWLTFPEEDPVHSSPSGRAAQLHFQPEVDFFFLACSSRDGEWAQNTGKNSAVWVQIRISASRPVRAVFSGSCAAARSTVRCHSAHYFKSRECDLRNLHGSVKSSPPFRQLSL